MNLQQRIDNVIDHFSNKELSFGCLVNYIPLYSKRIVTGVINYKRDKNEIIYRNSEEHSLFAESDEYKLSCRNVFTTNEDDEDYVEVFATARFPMFNCVELGRDGKITSINNPVYLDIQDEIRGKVNGSEIEKIIGHPVMIGDVLHWASENWDAIRKQCSFTSYEEFLIILNTHWEWSGINQSINEIFSREMEVIPDRKDEDGDWCTAIPIGSKQFKDPNINQLLTFLETLIDDK